MTFQYKTFKLILFLIFLVLSQTGTNGYSQEQCDCLGYYEFDNPNAIIPHSHGSSICTGYAFSHTTSDMGTPSGSRAEIYISKSTAKDYWTEWGFYQIIDSDDAGIGDIAIWMAGNVVDHAAVVQYDSPSIKVKYVQGSSATVYYNQDPLHDNESPDFYVHRVSNPYGYAVTLQTSFNGGNVIFDGNTKASGTKLSLKNNSSHTLDVNPRQYDSNYWRLYTNWKNSDDYILASDPDTDANITVTDFETYTANFNKEFDVTLQNNFDNVGNFGKIEVNGTEETLPHSAFPVRQDQSITFKAIYQVYNSIRYTFSQWHDGNTSYQRTITPGDHATYSASYSGKPQPVTITSSGGEPGTYVVITWQEHPNPNVDKYEVWRMVKPASGGSWTGPSNIATKNRGQTSFTDIDYENTATYSADLLKYDIRAHYSIENTDADPNWVYVNGDGMIKKLQGADDNNQNELIPAQSSLSNYPNPFTC